MTSPSVSVVVCTYRRGEMLAQTLALLAEQTYPDYEIIVIDQTPNVTTPPPTTVGSRGIKVQYIQQSHPSLPLARTTGAKIASSTIVLYVDDDTQPSPWLIASHMSRYADPSVGGVAGRRTYPLDVSIAEAMSPVGRLDKWARHITNFSSSQVFGPVQWASGCNMSFRRDLILRLGGFEPAFLGTATYEDVDFCFRVRRAGYQIVFEPNAHLVHLIAPTGGCEVRRIDERHYYSLIHNSLLFGLRNLSLWQTAMVLIERLAMIGALYLQGYPKRTIMRLYMAVPHAFTTWRTSISVQR